MNIFDGNNFAKWFKIDSYLFEWKKLSSPTFFHFLHTDYKHITFQSISNESDRQNLSFPISLHHVRSSSPTWSVCPQYVCTRTWCLDVLHVLHVMVLLFCSIFCFVFNLIAIKFEIIQSLHKWNLGYIDKFNVNFNECFTGRSSTHDGLANWRNKGYVRCFKSNQIIIFLMFKKMINS